MQQNYIFTFFDVILHEKNKIKELKAPYIMMFACLTINLLKLNCDGNELMMVQTQSYQLPWYPCIN
jgi:hypothetical protein